ncbi:MAG TPA: hypothetical protein VHO46_07910 [Bacteroidales bacterium]|nr:hypothetical protein [Bacteroidales bacterium]
MKLLRISIFLLLPFAAFSCRLDYSNDILIVTGNAKSYACPDSLLYAGGFKIGLINPEKPDQVLKPLTSDFFSACSPDLSFDGKSIIFSGRKNENDPWQIWEMNPGNNKFKQITSGSENCMFPVFLPGSQIVFSKELRDDSLKSGFSLFKCNTDGSNIERITFNPSSWYSSSILADGRILTKCSGNYPEKGSAEFIVLRPDGTKAELFYKNKGTLTGGKPVETDQGKIIFTEKTDGSTSKVNSISYNNPFNSLKSLSGDLPGDFLSVSSGFSGKLTACYRSSPEETYRLFEFDYENGLGTLLHENKDYDVIEALVLKERERPRKLPSEVDNLVKTGLLMCQDINTPSLQGNKRPSKIEILGLNASYGTIIPEQDGSVYLKVLADKPFRLVTMDEEGRVIRMCNWMSLRPNERRGCTGCHEDPEVVPFNRIPLAIKKAPVILPVHIEKIQEKTVELE